MNVNEWFANGPSTMIDTMVDMLKQDLEYTGLEFEHKLEIIKRKLSTALCFLYTLQSQNKPVLLGFPKSHILPLDWNPDMEEEWLDFLESIYFDYLYWERFWDSLPYAHWEDNMHGWREQFQCLIPLYIKRDIRKLYENEYETSESGVSSEQDTFIDDYPNK